MATSIFCQNAEFHHNYRSIVLFFQKGTAMKTAKIYVTVTEGIDEAALREAEALIPSWRREYSAKKRFPARVNSVFAYLLLQRLTKKEFGVFDPTPFTYKKADKPYFSKLDLFFSLSHCKTAVGAAASKSEIGFDIIDNRRVNERAAIRICSPDEWKLYEAAEDKQRFLLQLWCKKESMVKQSGMGFTEGFDTADTAKADFFTYEGGEYFAALYLDGGILGDKARIWLEEIPWRQLLCKN